MSKSKLLLLAMLAAAVSVSACGKNNPVAPQSGQTQGQLQFAVDMSGDPASAITGGSVTIVKDTMTLTRNFAIANHTGSVAFADVQVGHWTSTVQLFNAQGTTLYSGTGAADISLAKTTTLSVQLSQTAGALIISVVTPDSLIDNFDNDGNFASTAGQRDGNWWSMGNSYTFAMVTGIGGDSTPALKINYNKSAANIWDFVAIGDTNVSGKFHDYSQVRSVYLRVYAPASAAILLKFADASGRESGDVSTQAITTLNGWNTLVWDLSNVNWGTCDKTQINNVFFFIQPGMTGTGYLVLDNLTAN